MTRSALRTNHSMFISILSVLSVLACGGVSAQSSVQAGASLDKANKTDVFNNAKNCLEKTTAIDNIQNEMVATKNRDLSRKVQSAREDASIRGCSRDPQVLLNNYRAAVSDAAEAGNADAQLCYVQGYWGQGASPLDIQKYKVLSDKYMKQAFKRGDWRAVQLLTISPESVGHGGAGLMVNLPRIGEWSTVYAATRLLESGASGDYAKYLKNREAEAAQRLSKNQIATADQWAKTQYDSNFNKSNTLTEAPVPCLFGSP